MIQELFGKEPTAQITEEMLKDLPLRAIVAWSARCLRRAACFLKQKPGFRILRSKQFSVPLTPRVLLAVILDSIEAAESLATSSDDVRTAYAASAAFHTARAAAEIVGTAYDAYLAEPADDVDVLAERELAHLAHITEVASDSAQAVYDAVSRGDDEAYNVYAANAARAAAGILHVADADVCQRVAAQAAYEDFLQLRSLKLGSFPDLGKPVDLDQLGSLWPEGEPTALAEAHSEQAAGSFLEPNSDSTNLYNLRKTKRRPQMADAMIEGALPAFGLALLAGFIGWVLFVNGQYPWLLPALFGFITFASIGLRQLKTPLPIHLGRKPNHPKT